MKIKHLLFVLFMTVSLAGQSQALWILLFGDKLSNDKMQSGINVFVTTSNFNGMNNTAQMQSWALGGFMDFKIKDNWNISVEFTVKSPSGASGLLSHFNHYEPVDSLKNEDLRLENTNFSLPIYIKYKSKYFNLAAGPEMIFTYKSNFIYTATTIDDREIKVTESSSDHINKFDIGMSGSIEFYLFPKKPNASVRLGLRYYYGFMKPLVDYNNARNSILMLKVSIPIVGKNTTI